MTERRRSILHITRNLPPLLGGMERLNWHIADELTQVADVYQVGPKGSSARKPAGVTVAEVPLRPLWLFLVCSALKAIQVARRVRPNVILAGSGLTAPAALLVARLFRARAIVYVHGLDLVAAHPIYRGLWLPAVRQMDLVIANSRHTAHLAKTLRIKPERIVVINPGVQLAEKPKTEECLREFRDKHCLGSARLLLSVGRLTQRKGLLEFVQKSLPQIVSRDPDVILLVLGESPVNALNGDAQSPVGIQTAANVIGIGHHLHFLGAVDETTLTCAFEAASVHIFPVREIEGDTEGFGMVAIEAAAHGLPTIAFASGGVVDAVSDGFSGRLVTPNDYQAFSEAVTEALFFGSDRWKESSQRFAKEFEWPVFGRRLRHAVR